MIISNFAGHSLMAQAGSYTPQVKANFALVIAGLGQTERLVLSLKSAKIPPVQLSKKGIKYFNQTVFFAGSLEPQSNVALSFHDYLDNDILGVLSDWKRTVFNPATGGINFVGNYKKTAELMLLPPGAPVVNGFPGAVGLEPYNDRVWDLQGVWPTVLDYDDLDHDSDDNSMIRLEMSVDIAVPRRMYR
jgi:hypothetical protein